MTWPARVVMLAMLALLVTCAGGATNSARRAAPVPEIVFRGASDASGAVALDEKTILVADDEDNVLRAYAVDGGAPRARFDLARFLGTTADHPEADIEAATRVGPRVYVVTSHGPSRKGKPRPNRHRLFALEIRGAGAGAAVEGTGTPYRDLARALLGDPALAALVPGGSFDPSALNIEGLCAGADGRVLYLGLRSPMAAGARGGPPRAIAVPLENATDVLERGRAPRFGAPLAWDLGGRAIRDMTYSARHRALFVLAGSAGDGGGAALYRWSGDPGDAPALAGTLEPRWTPEALVAFDTRPELLVISDDGAVAVPVARRQECLEDYSPKKGTCPNKRLADVERRTFRARWVAP